MANQLSMAQVHTIESLRRAGYSNRRIARTLGIDRGTVKKYVRSLNSQEATAGSDKDADPVWLQTAAVVIAKTTAK